MPDLVLIPLFAIAGLFVGAVLPTITQQAPGSDPLLAGAGANEFIPIKRWFSPTSLPRWVVVSCEVVTSLLFVFGGLRFGLGAQIPVYLVFFAALVVVTIVDLEHYRIPDRITFPTLKVMAALVVIGSVATGSVDKILGALIGAVVYFVALLVPHLISPKGMGFGDVKLALVLGLALGWLNPMLILFALLISSLLGVLFGIVAAITQGKGSAFPFGPALAVGAIATVLASTQILERFGL